MTFIGMISDYKSSERVKEMLKNKRKEKINLININKRSISNIKNIKFDAIIIDLSLQNFENEKRVIEKLCENIKYLIINTDINKEINFPQNKDCKIITYGLNQKATVTVSSITDTNVLLYLQKNIKNNREEIVEVEERQIQVQQDNNPKIYEILINHILFLIYGN